MLTIFVYLCFIVGLADIVRMFFKLIGFIVNPEKLKKGGFLSGKFRNNDRKFESDGRNYGDSDRSHNRNDYRNDGDNGTGNIYNDRMSDITVE